MERLGWTVAFGLGEECGSLGRLFRERIGPSLGDMSFVLLLDPFFGKHSDRLYRFAEDYARAGNSRLGVFV